jgi:preprotein translocase subunit SecD
VPPTPGQIRPGRYLASFAGIVALLYALVFFTGDGSATPKLGIDLQGGTRVTLEARTESGGEPPREQLLQAQQIIEARVNGLGVSGAEVVLDGTNIVITVPGEEGDQARSLGQTAQLRIRPVIGQPYPVAPPGTPPTSEVPPGAPGAPPTEPTGQSTEPTEPTEQPQGAGVELSVKPVALFEPLPGSPPEPPEPSPSPSPSPPPGAGAPGVPADPEAADAIEQARQLRQSEDPTVLQQALLQLDCAAPDPLQGYDDPAKPLVTCDEDGTVKYLLGPAIIEGTQIDTAAARLDQNGIGYVVDLTFTAEGAAVWTNHTISNVGHQAAFVLDGRVVSAPVINEPIYDRTTQIEGQFSQEEAQELAGVLRYGALPLSFSASEAQTVSATLGLASLEAGLIAGGVGLLLVFVYCLFYYRVLGVLTILSLVLSGLIVYAVLILLGRWIGFTLDLAGVAGFIVAIGITADSFVIFFERLKDEMREGRTFRSAVPRGWVRARRTILSADGVSFLAAAVLYILAVGQVKGFAFTLGLSTVLDLLVVFLVTHPLVAMASHSKVFSSPAWSGLGSVARIGAERKRAAATAGAGKRG